MAYQGAAAYALAYEQTQTVAPVREAAPSFEVIEGDGLDARARRGVSTSFMAGVRLAIAVVFAVVAIGGARIAISTATVSQLREVRVLRSQVSELEDLNSRLEVERSIEASSQRIVAIATQAYGMVYASDVDTVVIPHEEDELALEEGLAQDVASVPYGSSGEAQGTQPVAQSAEDLDLAGQKDVSISLASGLAAMASAEATGEDGR